MNKCFFLSILLFYNNILGQSEDKPKNYTVIELSKKALNNFYTSGKRIFFEKYEVILTKKTIPCFRIAIAFGSITLSLMNLLDICYYPILTNSDNIYLVFFKGTLLFIYGIKEFKSGVDEFSNQLKK